MSQGFGRWLGLEIAGVAVFGISISQLPWLPPYRAKFREKLALRDMHTWEKIAVITLAGWAFVRGLW